MTEIVIDARGLRCPLPVIELARRFVEVPVGGTVTVLADDPAAASDIAAWCTMRGQTYLGSEPDQAAQPDQANRPGYQAYRVLRSS